MTDDSYYEMDVSQHGGFIEISVENASNIAGIVAFSAAAGGASTVLLGGGADIEVTTGALDGTTGNDNKFTVSAHTNGSLYLENRLGGTKNIIYTIHLTM